MSISFLCLLSEFEIKSMVLFFPFTFLNQHALLINNTVEYVMLQRVFICKKKKTLKNKTPTKNQPNPHIVLQCFPFKNTISLSRCLHLFDTKGYTKFHL